MYMLYITTYTKVENHGLLFVWLWWYLRCPEDPRATDLYAKFVESSNMTCVVFELSTFLPEWVIVLFSKNSIVMRARWTIKHFSIVYVELPPDKMKMTPANVVIYTVWFSKYKIYNPTSYKKNENQSNQGDLQVGKGYLFVSKVFLWPFTQNEPGVMQT